MSQRLCALIGFLIIVAFIAGTFAACVWIVASFAPAELTIRWQVTKVAFGVAFAAMVFILSLCQISGRESDAEERRKGMLT